jgi:hypothetical protein
MFLISAIRNLLPKRSPLLVRLRPLAPDRTSYAQPLIVPLQTPISSTGSPLRRIVSEFPARFCPTKRRSLHVSIQQVNAETAAAGPGLESRVIARPLTLSGRAKRNCCTSKRPASTRLPSASKTLLHFESNSSLFISQRPVLERPVWLLGPFKVDREYFNQSIPLLGSMYFLCLATPMSLKQALRWQ